MKIRFRQLGLLLCLLLVVALVLPVMAEQNGATIAGKVVNGQVYLPLRKTLEALDFKVSWDGDARLIVAQRGYGGEKLHFKPSQRYLLHDDVLIDGVYAPFIENGSTYIALDAIEQIFSSVKPLGGGNYQISHQLVAVDRSAKLLNNSEEIKALLSFYPRQDYMYRKGGVIMQGDVMMVEETMAASVEKDGVDGGFSNTNNQVEGVAESDIVKTDGKYIYALKGDQLQIIRAQRGKLEVVASIQSKDINPYEMFLADDKLVLIGEGYSADYKTMGNEDSLMIGRIYPNRMTFVDVYDISNVETAKPTRLKRISVDGYYQSGRRIDNYLYIVANQQSFDDMPIRFIDDPIKLDQLNQVDRLMYFPGHVTGSMLYTIGIDLNNLENDAVDINTYLGGAEHIYADRENFYIADTRYNWSYEGDNNEKTDIYKFAIKDGKFSYQNSCVLNGTVLNQFSMDVHKGYFRIAMTTRDNKEWNKTLNHLLILDQDLTVVGKVSNLAPGERIYSTRMMGDKVFIVTYRQVDPFYVIDASVPTKPYVMGYLKIPGYSSYLHPYDKNTIIGVGMNTKVVDNDRVINDGVKISLFDISNPEKPIEKDMVIVGDGRANTEVNYDHKAFLFNATKNILAIPVSLPTDYGYSKDAYIFEFTKSGKLQLKGTITHSDLSHQDKHYSDYNKEINRILYIGDDLYTLSNGYLFLNDFNSLENIDILER